MIGSSGCLSFCRYTEKLFQERARGHGWTPVGLQGDRSMQPEFCNSVPALAGGVQMNCRGMVSGGVQHDVSRLVSARVPAVNHRRVNVAQGNLGPLGVVNRAICTPDRSDFFFRRRRRTDGRVNPDRQVSDGVTLRGQARCARQIERRQGFLGSVPVCNPVASKQPFPECHGESSFQNGGRAQPNALPTMAMQVFALTEHAA